MASFSKRRDNISTRLKDIKNQIDELEADIESHFDSRSEKWQEGERGQACEEAGQEVSNASSDLDSMIEEFDMIEFKFT